jgi:mono/diheme cytochrome c family protein
MSKLDRVLSSAALFSCLACTGSIDANGDGPGAAAGGDSSLPDAGQSGSAGNANTGGASGDTDASTPVAGAPNAGTSSFEGKTGVEVFGLLCSTCHGPNGEGTALGPELQHPVTGFSTWVARNGRDSDSYPGPMIAYAATLVTDQQLEEIWTWLGNLPQPTTGETLYLDYCANCHGADARGGRVGQNITEKGNELLDLTEKVREGAGGTNYGTAAQYMPHWSTSEISADELSSIAGYLTTL